METFEEKSELEAHKAKLQIDIEIKKAFLQEQIELFKATISYGQNAIKASFLVNGGASIAILTFIGKLSELNSHAVNIKALSVPLLLFTSGLCCVLIATGTSYVAQSCFQLKKTNICKYINYATIGLIILSNALFSYGIYMGYLAFQNF